MLVCLTQELAVVSSFLSLLSNAALINVLTTGIWALDIAKELPSTAIIYGTDIENRLFPIDSERPSNIVFQTGSILSLPDGWSSKFDLIHQRLLLYALRAPEWTTALESMLRCVKPGGTIQLTEVVTPPNSEAGPFNRKWFLLLDKFCESRGILLHCAKLLPGLMKSVGFEHISCYETGLVLGSKGGDAGMEARKSRIGAFRGMKTPILKAGQYIIPLQIANKKR
jgi:SAM-dependent methyltransferase